MVKPSVVHDLTRVRSHRILNKVLNLLWFEGILLALIIFVFSQHCCIRFIFHLLWWNGEERVAVCVIQTMRHKVKFYNKFFSVTMYGIYKSYLLDVASHLHGLAFFNLTRNQQDKIYWNQIYSKQIKLKMFNL